MHDLLQLHHARPGVLRPDQFVADLGKMARHHFEIGVRHLSVMTTGRSVRISGGMSSNSSRNTTLDHCRSSRVARRDFCTL
jgi:hypothetical protein